MRETTQLDADITAKAVNAAKKAASDVRTACELLRTKRNALRSEMSQVKARNEYILRLPLTREDAKQFVLSTIDEMGSDFPKKANWGRVFEHFAYPQNGREYGRQMLQAPLCLHDVESVEGKGEIGVVSRLGLGLNRDSLFNGLVMNMPANDTSRFCFFFGDLIKAKIEEHFEEFFPDFTKEPRTARFVKENSHFDFESPDLQISAADRRAEVEANRQRIVALGHQIVEIDANILALDTSFKAPAGDQSLPVTDEELADVEPID